MLLVVLAAIGAPALALRVLCVGNTCTASSSEQPRVPFCPLPTDLKAAIANGFREGRSADVLAVTEVTTPVAGPTRAGPGLVAWPSAATATDVPLVFAGVGVSDGPVELPPGTTLDQVAPTVASIAGLERPFPEVRSGTALEGFAADAGPRLILLVAWKGVGSEAFDADAQARPFVSGLLASGAGTTAADTGSVPLDPAAVLTTIGTGGLPSQHGITGALVRNDEGSVVPAFGAGAPVTVIATLADDLEGASRGRALVGLVAPERSDQGIVGGGWYPDEDPPAVILEDGGGVPDAVEALLEAGLGSDAVTDILAVVLDGSLRSMDARTRRIVTEVERATGGSTLTVVVGTGGTAPSGSTPAVDLLAAVEAAVPGERPVVEAAVAGGLFLDQTVLEEQRITGRVVVEALLDAETADGERMVADAFQGFAVSFARYC